MTMLKSFLIFVTFMFLTTVSYGQKSDFIPGFADDSTTEYPFLVKVSPFDWMRGRLVFAAELPFFYSKSKYKMIEVNFTYDYLANTDIIYGDERVFGNYYRLGVFHKQYFKKGKLLIKKDRRQLWNGFFWKTGIDVGISPVLDGESVFRYTMHQHDDRSFFVGIAGDIGYAWHIRRINIETFMGLGAYFNSRSQSSMLEGDELIYDYNPAYTFPGRFGLRVGYEFRANPLRTK